MGKAMTDIRQMELIYSASKDVYEGKYSKEYAASSLLNMVSATQSSLKMYFDIYASMRDGKCYKMGTSERFTHFLLNHIFSDFGEEAYRTALIAVKGNYEYRISVDNSQPGILRACKESIADCGVNIDFAKLPSSFVPDTEDVIEDLNENNDLSAKDIIRGTDAGDIFELNIQPAASILNVFSRLSYKPWYAIAEFVDNSTQSYISHEAELQAVQSFEKLMVEIRYNASENTLRIADNAFGMEIERFYDAILLDSKNNFQSGRNEFGMGLKTAASWFGNIWSVTSTQLGSENRYTATVNIPKLKELGINSVQIHRDYVAPEIHGTEIFIRDVTKKITGARTISKIRDLLSGMYRRDINNRNIEIWFNDEPIVFEEYPVLTNFRGKIWKKQLDFDVHFSDKNYNVTGFVAIMNPGSFPKAGFALFRQDRVVVGGTDSNYKPSAIFGQAQSQKSLKLFGELNMNSFPVNQAKDGFIWDDGLEDAFVDALKENIQEYIEIAEMSIKERANETQYSEEASKDLERDVAESFNKAFDEALPDDDNPAQNTCNFEDEQHNDIQEYIDTVLHNDFNETIVGTKREYIIPFNTLTKVKFSVRWAIGTKKYWIEYSEIAENSFDVVININHPFFMPYSKDENFKRVLEKFVLSFILAEWKAKLTSDKHGYISANSIKNFMNKFLDQLAEE